MIYAAYDKKTGDRVDYAMSRENLQRYSPEEYVIVEHESFEEMTGLPVLTDEDRQFISEALESGEIQAIDVDKI